MRSRKISKVKQEYLDIDYWTKLEPKHQQYLADFLAEELNAEVPAQSKAKQTRFNKSKKQVKRVVDSHNARQRDIHGQMRAQGRLMYLSNENMSEHFDDKTSNRMNSVESNLVDIITESQTETKEDRIKDLEDRKKVLYRILSGEIGSVGQDWIYEKELLQIEEQLLFLNSEPED